MEFCQDQNGSRFIQQRLEVGDTVEKEVVMAEVLPAIRRLRNDVFGNYVVQKLLDFGTPRMKSEIRDTLQGEMLQLSLQMYGYVLIEREVGFVQSCWSSYQFALHSSDVVWSKRLLRHWRNQIYQISLKNSTTTYLAASTTRMEITLSRNASRL